MDHYPDLLTCEVNAVSFVYLLYLSDDWLTVRFEVIISEVLYNLIIRLRGQPDHVHCSHALTKVNLYLLTELSCRSFKSVDLRRLLWEEIRWYLNLAKEIPHIFYLDPGLLY